MKFEDGNQLGDFGVFAAERTGTELAALLEDRSGAVWIGTSYSGLFRYDGASFESIPTAH